MAALKPKGTDVRETYFPMCTRWLTFVITVKGNFVSTPEQELFTVNKTTWREEGEVTNAELEKEVRKLNVKLDVIVSCLTQHSTLPILGAMSNWEAYETALRREMAEAGLQD